MSLVIYKEQIIIIIIIIIQEGLVAECGGKYIYI
jgi:hypothetical protein